MGTFPVGCYPEVIETSLGFGVYPLHALLARLIEGLGGGLDWNCSSLTLDNVEHHLDAGTLERFQ